MQSLFDKELQQKIIDFCKKDPYGVNKSEIQKNYKIFSTNIGDEFKLKTNINYLAEEGIIIARYNPDIIYLTHQYIKKQLAAGSVFSIDSD